MFQITRPEPCEAPALQGVDDGGEPCTPRRADRRHQRRLLSWILGGIRTPPNYIARNPWAMWVEFVQ